MENPGWGYKTASFDGKRAFSIYRRYERIAFFTPMDIGYRVSVPARNCAAMVMTASAAVRASRGSFSSISHEKRLGGRAGVVASAKEGPPIPANMRCRGQ